MEDAVIHLATAARSTAAISVHDCPREDEHLRMLAHTVPVSNGDISASDPRRIRTRSPITFPGASFFRESGQRARLEWMRLFESAQSGQAASQRMASSIALVSRRKSRAKSATESPALYRS